MKAEELRIGNYVYFNEEIDLVESISHNIIHGKLFSNYEISEIKPIPLTEEWLFKMGFNNFLSSKNTYETQYCFVDFIEKGLCRVCYPGYPKKGIRYVHELQNYYYVNSLRFTELIIK